MNDGASIVCCESGTLNKNQLRSLLQPDSLGLDFENWPPRPRPCLFLEQAPHHQHWRGISGLFMPLSTA